VQLELNQFGLLIYNANIKQLVDIKGTEYFSFLGQKGQQTAANQAKVDVAEARYKGDTGAKERQGATLMNAAKVDADTAMFSKSQSGAAKQQEIKVRG
jgi:flotillin